MGRSRARSRSRSHASHRSTRGATNSRVFLLQQTYGPKQVNICCDSSKHYCVVNGLHQIEIPIQNLLKYKYAPYIPNLIRYHNIPEEVWHSIHKKAYEHYNKAVGCFSGILLAFIFLLRFTLYLLIVSLICHRKLKSCLYSNQTQKFISDTAQYQSYGLTFSTRKSAFGELFLVIQRNNVLEVSASNNIYTLESSEPIPGTLAPYIDANSWRLLVVANILLPNNNTAEQIIDNINYHVMHPKGFHASLHRFAADGPVLLCERKTNSNESFQFKLFNETEMIIPLAPNPFNLLQTNPMAHITPPLQVFTPPAYPMGGAPVQYNQAAGGVRMSSVGMLPPQTVVNAPMVSPSYGNSYNSPVGAYAYDNMNAVAQNQMPLRNGGNNYPQQTMVTSTNPTMMGNPGLVLGTPTANNNINLPGVNNGMGGYVNGNNGPQNNGGMQNGMGTPVMGSSYPPSNPPPDAFYSYLYDNNNNAMDANGNRIASNGMYNYTQ